MRLVSNTGRELFKYEYRKIRGVRKMARARPRTTYERHSTHDSRNSQERLFSYVKRRTKRSIGVPRYYYTIIQTRSKLRFCQTTSVRSTLLALLSTHPITTPLRYHGSCRYNTNACKSPRPDRLHLQLLLFLLGIISEPLTVPFNMSLFRTL